MKEKTPLGLNAKKMLFVKGTTSTVEHEDGGKGETGLVPRGTDALNELKSALKEPVDAMNDVNMSMQESVDDRSLLPKTEHPEKVTEVRLISLCNVVYKVISSTVL